MRNNKDGVIIKNITGDNISQIADQIEEYGKTGGFSLARG